jgi:uncharacterized SAM-binding protein YcdF (DUF218 family)
MPAHGATWPAQARRESDASNARPDRASARRSAPQEACLSLSAIATIFVVPPVNLAVLALLFLLLGGRVLRGLAMACLALLLVLGMPAVAQRLLVSLESVSVPPPPVTPQAIVVLSAELAWDAGPPPSPDVGQMTLERLRAAADLARRTHLPILVTGGIVESPDAALEGRPDGGAALAEVMAGVLEKEFGLTPRWVEARSQTTWENAAFSAPMLRADGISSVYVVTHAWHERRALVAFRAAGMPMVPAPVREDAVPPLHLSGFIPVAGGWQRSYYALHEWIGLLWYDARRALG